MTEASCAGGTLPHQGCLWRVTPATFAPCQHEPTCLSALLSGSQHQGGQRGRSHCRPSLSVTGEGGQWCHQPGQAGEGNSVGLGVSEIGPTGPLLCSQHWHLADVLVLGRTEGCSEGWGARSQETRNCGGFPMPDPYREHLPEEDNSQKYPSPCCSGLRCI